MGQTQQAVGRGQSIQKKEKLPSISEIFLALETERDFFSRQASSVKLKSDPHCRKSKNIFKEQCTIILTTEF